MYSYSQRLHWDVPPNLFSRRIESARQAGQRVVDLTTSNPTEAFADYPHAAIREAFAASGDFSYRPEPFGQEAARAAVAGLYRGRGFTVLSDRIALTASTSEAYSLLFQLLCDPGSEVLVPVPSYPLFEYLAALAAVRLVPYRLVYDGAWFFDFPDLEAKITGHTRAIVIVNPNNPTGSYLKTDEADTLLHLAEAHGLPIVSDEVFCDYALEPSRNHVKSLLANDSVLTFSLDGLSKTAAMPQMKLGWMVLGGRAEDIQTARSRLELLLDTYLSVSTPIQNAAPRLLEIGAALARDVLGRVARNAKRLAEVLGGSPAHPLRNEGGWSAIVQLPALVPEDTWTERLLAGGVLVQPGYFFDMPGGCYVVISLLTPPDRFDEGVTLLRKVVYEVAGAQAGGGT